MNAKLTISELKIKKKKLDTDISNLLNEFHIETGLFLENINIERRIEVNKGYGKVIYLANCIVNLDWVAR